MMRVTTLYAGSAAATARYLHEVLDAGARRGAETVDGLAGGRVGVVGRGVEVVVGVAGPPRRRRSGGVP